MERGLPLSLIEFNRHDLRYYIKSHQHITMIHLCGEARREIFFGNCC